MANSVATNVDPSCEVVVVAAAEAGHSVVVVARADPAAVDLIENLDSATVEVD